MWRRGCGRRPWAAAIRAWIVRRGVRVKDLAERQSDKRREKLNFISRDNLSAHAEALPGIWTV